MIKHMPSVLQYFGIALLIIAGCKKDAPAPAPTPPPVVLSSEKKITAFSLLKKDNPALESDLIGTITGNAIVLETLASMTARDLKATFTVSDKATVYIAGVKQVSGVTSASYASKLTLDVEAEDKSKTAYTVELKTTGNAPNMTVNATTSYALRTQAKTWVNYGTTIPQSLRYGPGSYLARAFHDFDKDGDEDLIMGNLSYDWVNNKLLNTPNPVNYLENRSSTFVDVSGTKFTGGVPGLVHPRKAILGDYDKNGWMDVVMAGHGFDAPPFPGENSILLKNNNGIFSKTDILPIGFYHSVCSGDIDNDGDLDLFFTDTKNCRFLLNNGSGVFTYDNSIFPSDIANLNYFTSELYDLNADGYLDLVTTGHEHEGANSIVLWGDHTGKYTKARSFTIPKVAGWGVAIDIIIMDVNKDGKQDILLNRQGDGTGSQQNFHGLRIQLLVQEAGNIFTDRSSTLINGNPQTSHPQLSWFWVDWLRLIDTDGDGDQDLVTDNRFYNLQWRNDNGVFVKY
ncbi:MAG: FG-GAP repeat domain-containing protein [bacterium]|jgi:hypothetical protein